MSKKSHKSLGRDTTVLRYINKNIEKIQNAIKLFKCDFTQSPSGLCRNEMAFDLCSMYMAQIGENVKLLSDSSRSALNKHVDLSNLVYFRNRIDHSYEKVDKVYLQSYIQLVVSKEFKNAIKEQYEYCVKNRRV